MIYDKSIIHPSTLFAIASCVRKQTESHIIIIHFESLYTVNCKYVFLRICLCVFCGTFPICLYFTILFVILLLALWWRHHPIDVTLSYYPHHHTLYAALSYECSCFVVAFIVSTRVFALHAQHICAPNPRRRLHNSYSNTLPSNPNSPIYVIKYFFFSFAVAL